MAGRDAEAALGMAGAGLLRSGDPVRIGPYVPLGLLGSGGMGRVYLARPTAHGGERLAAVKVIRPEYAESVEFRRRFEREAAVLARVRSPHAPRLLDTGFDSDLLWMATEYLPGPNLSEAVQEFGPLPASGVWRLVGELGRALDELTAAQVVHRDLKPSNVILGTDGAYVIDFGISQAADASSITTTGKAVGTPAYMSPERLRDGRADVVSDVFSLACTLVFAATGRAPFGDGTGVDVMHRVAFEEPYADVIEELVSVDPGLADLLSACLAKEPGRRPTPGRLSEAAAARPWPGRWHEPLHAQVAARREAYDVLSQVPVDGTVQLRLPGAGIGAGAPGQAPAPAAFPPSPASVAASPGPVPPPGGTLPRETGVRGEPSGRGRKRRVRLAVVASLAVVAVALAAFLMTRPGEPESEAGPAPAGSVSASDSPGQSGESGLTSPSASGTAPGGSSPGADGGGRDGAPSSGASSTRPASPTRTASGRPGGQESQKPRPPTTRPKPTRPTPPWIKQCTYYSGNALTRFGDKGQRVVQVQCVLSKRGYGIGGAGVDGQFGEDTRAAVKKFQGAKGLDADGMVGPNTWAALRSRT
ncbi:serine/threonine-protein kinase [Streptomyces luteolus]|uniref:Serine/threonine-protein kinase n=1 Tax=Streptomyces luteolus TaxID=3043615 RepID=A0ABT6SSI5_9ACTN|nr:serine/threonine-protein kinase [Streptomyces sp. B-S-A12]MDI3418559.1 serine/threonine-protein kinase [Streptomyces sp. B-S-A12]